MPCKNECRRGYVNPRPLEERSENNIYTEPLRMQTPFIGKVSHAETTKSIFVRENGEES